MQIQNKFRLQHKPTCQNHSLTSGAHDHLVYLTQTFSTAVIYERNAPHYPLLHLSIPNIRQLL